MEKTIILKCTVSLIRNVEDIEAETTGHSIKVNNKEKPDFK